MTPAFRACQVCGHVHRGGDLAFICVGCPCTERPGRPDLAYDADFGETAVTPAVGPFLGCTVCRGRGWVPNGTDFPVTCSCVRVQT